MSPVQNVTEVPVHSLNDPWRICASVTEHCSRPLNVCIVGKYPDQVDPPAF